ncbi:CPBP family intramembrane glutamic endopeptidase [Jidongwangia harbinensis]|uniref:CPBP family intramembrane glutamic endopeptidase n=1 Tax=Jidongwangia harbinensis TaxID=2878561 RepID=UPI001CD9A9E7|nr:CPBP family intramembrane glutamic endopeptidase [Jidongwangia harbinensis]MCA2211520.1 CPBP family intramembrane metalloprotease [Jidongwangia harbinensis]
MRFVKQFLAVFVVMAVCGQVTVAVQEDQPWLTLVAGVLSAVLTILTYRWVVRRTERRAVTELAGGGSRFGAGVLIGAAMFGAVAVNLAFNAGFDVHGIGSVPNTFGVLGVMAAAAVTEEVFFRGVLFRILEEKAGTYVSLLLTGVVFGAMHLFNEDATVWGALAIAVEAGFMLAACFAATRNLWVPIGLHFTWNFLLAGIFSLTSSGNGLGKGLLDVTLSGPEVFTGGEFGPEGGVAAVGVGVLLTLSFLVMAHRRGHIVRPGGRGAVAVGPGAGHGTRR